MSNKTNVSQSNISSVVTTVNNLDAILKDKYRLNQALLTTDFKELIKKLQQEDMPITEAEFIEAQQFGSKS